MIIFIGYISLSLSIGFLLGASNSPVIGAFITAFFGLVGTIIGAQYLFDKDAEQSGNLKHLGIGITLASIGLVAGTLTGEGYRKGWGDKAEKVLPWTGTEPPSITAEALDWIATSEKLKSLGYSDDDIRSIYMIRVDERKKLEKALEIEVNNGVDEFSRTEVYESGTPYNSLLSIPIGAKNQSRGPASLDPEGR